MRVQKVTLREIRMPMVMPFETSFGETKEPADSAGAKWNPTASSAGANAWQVKRRIIRRRRLTPRGIFCAIFCGPQFGAGNSAAAATFGKCWRTCAATTWPRAESRQRSGMRRQSRKGQPLWKLLGGSARRNRVRRLDRDSRRPIDELIANVEKRTRGGVPANQDQNQAGAGCRSQSRSTAQAFAAHTPDGGREFRVPPGRRAAVAATRRRTT